MILVEAITSCTTYILSLVSSSYPSQTRNTAVSEDTAVLINSTEVEYNSASCDTENNFPIPSLERESPLKSYGTCNQRRSNLRKTGFHLKLLRGAWVSLSIITALLPMEILSVLLLYIILNTSNLCFEYKHRYHNLPENVTLWNGITGAIEQTLVHMWFPASLMFMFGWKKFNSNFLTTVYISIAFANLLLIYDLLLLVFGVYEKLYILSRCIDHGMFLTGVLYNSYFVAKRIRNTDCLISFSKPRIMATISIQFFFGFIITLVYTVGIIPWYKKTANGVQKAAIAASTSALTVIPLIICKTVAIRSLTLVEHGRKFILVYFLEGLPEVVYKIMQSSVDRLWVFICLSALHGSGCLFAVITKNLRYFLWKQFLRCCRNICPSCSATFQEPQNESPSQKRFKADLEIQRMIFKYSSLILMQAYLALYAITNYETPAWDVLKEVLFRILIGFGIELFFNVLTITLEIHWHNIPISEVWFKRWKLHISANSLAAAMTVLYFTQFLLNVVREHALDAHHGNMISVQNCTAPFKTLY